MSIGLAPFAAARVGLGPGSCLNSKCSRGMCLESAFRRDKIPGFGEINDLPPPAVELCRAKSIPRFDRPIIVLRPRGPLCLWEI